MDLIVSSVVEVQKWLVLKSKTFGQKQHAQRKQLYFENTMNVDVCQNCTYKVNFVCQKLMEFFDCFFIWKYNLGNHPLLKTSFSNFNFWTTLYSKIMPDFWRADIHCIQKIQLFPLNKLIFVPKILLFGTHHFWNSTNELTLNGPTSDHQHLFQSYLKVLTY